MDSATARTDGGLARGVATWIVPAGALVLYAIACLVAPMGLLSSAHGGDVSYYETIGELVAHGHLPYRDFYLEYPPGALPVLVAPAVSAAHYALLFKLLMAACGAGALVAAWRALRLVEAGAGRVVLALGTIALAPLLLGSVFLNRYDAWPAFLTVLALSLLLGAREIAAASALALGVVAKVFPIVAVPLVAVEVARRRGSTRFRRSALAFVAVGAVTTLPFAALGSGGLAYSFYIQATRHLQVESLGGSALLVADRLGLYHARLVVGKPGSLDVFGTLPNAIGVASTVLEAVAAVAVAVWYVRGSATAERTICGVAAVVTAYVAFGKALSPQYLVWLVPLVPLVAGRVGRTAAGLFAAALVLTRVEFAHYASISHVGPVVWLVLVRNLLLVVIALLLLREVRAGAQDGASQTSKMPALTSR